MYPKLVINKNKLFHNTKRIVEMAQKCGISIHMVTKVHSGNAELAQVCLDAGVYGLADSRIQNLEKLKHLPCEKILLR